MCGSHDGGSGRRGCVRKFQYKKDNQIIVSKTKVIKTTTGNKITPKQGTTVGDRIEHAALHSMNCSRFGGSNQQHDNNGINAPVVCIIIKVNDTSHIIKY